MAVIHTLADILKNVEGGVASKTHNQGVDPMCTPALVALYHSLLR